MHISLSFTRMTQAGW